MRLDEYFFYFCIPCILKSYIHIFGVLVVPSSIAPEIKRRLKIVSFAVRNCMNDLIVNVALEPLYIHEEGGGDKT